MKHYTFKLSNGIAFENDYGYIPDFEAHMLSVVHGAVVELYEDGVLILTADEREN